MKQNKVKLYAKALAEIALEPKKGGGRMSANFLVLVKKNNLEKRLKEIVALAEDIILAKQNKNKIIFETARKITPSQKKLLTGITKDGDIIKEKINPDLIAGVKIIINESKQFDASMQKKLQEIF